jgi:hypothetical protein
MIETHNAVWLGRKRLVARSHPPKAEPTAP